MDDLITRIGADAAQHPQHLPPMEAAAAFILIGLTATGWLTFRPAADTVIRWCGRYIDRRRTRTYDLFHATPADLRALADEREQS